MFISKTPLRISLGGGGTDLPSYYQQDDGFWISGAINKYIYVIIKSRFEKMSRISYSALEYVENLSQIEHPIIREALKLFNIPDHIEIISIADLPSRSGLGSSGAFCVGLLNALHHFVGDIPSDNSFLSPAMLAEEAFHLEHNILHLPVGKQDHFSASFGGVNTFSCDKEGRVEVIPLPLVDLNHFCQNLSLFYTGQHRSSSSILQHQTNPESLFLIKQLAKIGLTAILNQNPDIYGSLLGDHWSYKKQTPSISTPELDNIYSYALLHGAIGGKLVGAGGGGFFLFCSSNLKSKSDLVNSLEHRYNLRHIPFSFVQNGSVVTQI